MLKNSLNWEYVNYITRPYLENPEMKIVNVNISEDENGISTLVVHFVPMVEVEPTQKEIYAEGKI